MGIYVGKAPEVPEEYPKLTSAEIVERYEELASRTSSDWDAQRYIRRAWWFLTHIPRFIWTWIRYLFTGDCGHICGAIIVDEHCSTGEQDYPDFIPECGCPIHDWRDWLF